MYDFIYLTALFVWLPMALVAIFYTPLRALLRHLTRRKTVRIYKLNSTKEI